MGMMSEFKDFSMRGSVVDVAVGIIIGAAFGKIVSSFVSDVIMPPIGVMVGGVAFTNLAVTVQKASEGVEAVTIKYGAFLQTVFDFLIIALVIFMVIRFINSLKKKEEASAVPPKPSAEEKLLTEIRDLLKK